MALFRRFSVNFALFSMGLDALLIGICLGLATAVRPSMNALWFAEPVELDLRLPGVLYGLFPLIWVGVLNFTALYDGRRNLRMVNEIASLTVGSGLAAVSLAGTLYLSFRMVSRLLFIFFVLLAYTLMLAWRILARSRSGRYGYLGEAPRRVLIAGAGPVGRKLQEQIQQQPDLQICVVGFLDDSPEKLRQCADVFGTLEEARAVVEHLQASDVVIALPARAHERLRLLAAELHKLPVKVWVIPDYFSLALHKAVIEDFAGLPLLDLRAPALNDYQRLLKRAFDLVFTVLLLPVALPLMAFIALAIRLDGPGEVIFRQKRVGENGRLFEVFKFRSMVPNAEALRHLVEHYDEQGNLIHKSADDPRVTRIGRFLRRTSLDELPQIFNILYGDMSWVGPRPELPYLVDRYQPWQRQRLAVPPGMTGWWQIHGRSDRPMHLHTEDDLYYVQNYSLLLDIHILIRTAFSVLKGKGAY